MTSIVKLLRQALMLTQSELGNKLGVCRQMIAAYEKKVSIPGFDVIKKIICLAHEVDLEINVNDFYSNMLSANMMKKIKFNSIDENTDCNFAKNNLGLPNRVKDRTNLIKLLNKTDLIKFYKNCCICGWGEGVIDMAHIGEHKKGFHFTYDNIVPLCPNHHRLFDRNLFKEDEKEKVRIFISNITQRVDEYRSQARHDLDNNIDDFFINQELSTEIVNNFDLNK